MIRFRMPIGYLAAACVVVSSFGQAWADPQESTSASTAVTTSASGALGKSVAARSPYRFVASMPKQVAGAIAGFVVGTPICVVRKTVDDDWDAVQYMTGGSKRRRVLIPAALFWLPFAAVDGSLLAPIHSLKNTLENFDKPFSKDQFSLGEKA